MGNGDEWGSNFTPSNEPLLGVLGSQECTGAKNKNNREQGDDEMEFRSFFLGSIEK